MRVISKARLRRFWQQHADAEAPLTRWYATAKAARWANLAEVRQAYPAADAVKLSSGATVTVFNIGGNKYRLITAIHYNRRSVFTLMILSHAEHSKGAWKDVL